MVNDLTLLRLFTTAAAQVVPSAEYAVDSFFVMSGALAAFQLLKGTAIALSTRPLTRSLPAKLGYTLISEPRGTRVTVVGFSSVTLKLAGLYWYYALHRVLRLLPGMIAMIAILLYVAPLAGSGPFWASAWDGIRAPCLDRWWTDVIFLNNFLPLPWEENSNGVCAPWLWYTAVDTQLYLAIPPLVWTFYFLSSASTAAVRRWRWVVWGTAVAASLSAVISVVLTKNLTFFVVSTNPTDMADMSKYFYSMPWTRSPAFIFGAMLGCALWEWETGPISHTSTWSRLQDMRLCCGRSVATESEHRLRLLSADPDGAAPSNVDARNGGIASCEDDQDDDSALHRLASRLAQLILPQLKAPPADKPFTKSICSRINAGACLVLAATLFTMGFVFYIPVNAYQGELAVLDTAATGGAIWAPAAQRAFTVLYRPLWAASVAVLLYMCATERGGGLGVILGAKRWAPLARLSWGAYLLHPLVTYISYFSTTQASDSTAEDLYQR